jgi:hypothetical protein
MEAHGILEERGETFVPRQRRRPPALRRWTSSATAWYRPILRQIESRGRRNLLDAGVERLGAVIQPVCQKVA